MFKWFKSFFPRRRFSLSGSNWMDGDERTEAQVVSDGQLALAKTNWWRGFIVGAITAVVLMLFGLTLLGYLGNFWSWLGDIELTVQSLIVLVLIVFAAYWLFRLVRNNYQRQEPFSGRLDRYGKRNKQEPAPAGSQSKSTFWHKAGIGTDHQGGGS